MHRTNHHTELKEYSTLSKVGLTIICMKRGVSPMHKSFFSMNTPLRNNNPLTASNEWVISTFISWCMFYFRCCEMFTLVPLSLSDFIAAAVKVPSPPIREITRKGIFKFVNQYHYAFVIVV